MKTATVADLRNQFSRISKWIEEGQAITITRRGKSFATLSPAQPVPTPSQWPDLAARRAAAAGGAVTRAVPTREALDYIRGDY